MHKHNPKISRGDQDNPGDLLLINMRSDSCIAGTHTTLSRTDMQAFTYFYHTPDWGEMSNTAGKKYRFGWIALEF
jgi:hypothetical protein